MKDKEQKPAEPITTKDKGQKPVEPVTTAKLPWRKLRLRKLPNVETSNASGTGSDAGIFSS